MSDRSPAQLIGEFQERKRGLDAELNAAFQTLDTSIAAQRGELKASLLVVDKWANILSAYQTVASRVRCEVSNIRTDVQHQLLVLREGGKSGNLVEKYEELLASL